MKDLSLLDQIVESARATPLECQEKVLEILKAMEFTNKVVHKKRTNQPKQPA